MSVCCETVRVTAKLVWGPGESWLRLMDIWVVHMFWPVHMTCER